MGFLIILPFTCLCAYVIISIRRWLGRAALGEKWLNHYRNAVVVGTVLGCALAFFVHYKVGNNKIEGFPMPASMSNRVSADEPWLPSRIPPAVSIFSQITDVLFGVAVSLAPLAVAAFMKENRGQLTNENTSPGQKS